MANLMLVNPDPTKGPAFQSFDEAAGIRVQKFDPGFPEIREVVDQRPHQHGTANYTKFFGAREVTIEFMILPQITNASVPDPLTGVWGPLTRRMVIDNLRGLCNPDLRPWLLEAIDGNLANSRRIQVVPGQFSIPFEFTNRNICQITFKCPEGYWESWNEKTVSLTPADAAGSAASGRVYTGGAGQRVYPRDYPASVAPIGGSLIKNTGNLESYPLVRLQGPFNDTVSIYNTTTGKGLYFHNLGAFADNEYIEIDLKERTAIKNGNINLSMYSKIIWSSSEWFSLPIGGTYMVFNPAGTTGPTTQATVTWRDNWI